MRGSNEQAGRLNERRMSWLAAAGIVIAAAALLAGGAPTGGARTEPTQRKAKPAESAALRFEISFPKEASATPLDGRVFLLLSKDDKDEPRFQMTFTGETQQIFGVDVEGLAPGAAAVVDGATLGYPLDSIAQIPAGDYSVQGLLNIYDTFHLASGKTVKLPMDRGEGQQWNRKPGNLYSKPQKMRIDSRTGGAIRISLTEKIPPIEPPQDTKYVKHLKIRSELLSKFWGLPMEISAVVLLPEEWEEHPNAHYPLMVYQGHFSRDLEIPLEFRTIPPTSDLKGRKAMAAKASFKFYQDWISGRLPRMIVLMIQHANPYYDDSYAVNSANVGPYGDAIMKEVIPEVERRFRGIGQGWARALYGGSTGGWEALGMQIFYPSEFNGSWGLCPDPIDFRAYMMVNLYEDKNALWVEGPWTKTPRPAARKPDGTILSTMEMMNRYEAVLGTHGRSTEQFGIWQAVFSPAGDDGYPKLIWNPYTGVIDHDVAAYWRDHYDLRYILERDWKTLGPLLVGKLHITVGTRDTYYLDNAVRLMEEFLKHTNNPYYAGDFEYGPHQPHCFTGNADKDSLVGASDLNQRILPRASAWMEKTAPKGADVTSWKY